MQTSTALMPTLSKLTEEVGAKADQAKVQSGGGGSNVEKHEARSGENKKSGAAIGKDKAKKKGGTPKAAAKNKKKRKSPTSDEASVSTRSKLTEEVGAKADQAKVQSGGGGSNVEKHEARSGENKKSGAAIGKDNAKKKGGTPKAAAKNKKKRKSPTSDEASVGHDPGNAKNKPRKDEVILSGTLAYSDPIGSVRRHIFKGNLESFNSGAPISKGEFKLIRVIPFDEEIRELPHDGEFSGSYNISNEPSNKNPSKYLVKESGMKFTFKQKEGNPKGNVFAVSGKGKSRFGTYVLSGEATKHAEEDGVGIGPPTYSVALIKTYYTPPSPPNAEKTPGGKPENSVATREKSGSGTKKARPNPSRQKNLEGMKYYKDGDYEAAATKFKEGASINPNEPNHFHNLTQCYYHLSDYDSMEQASLSCIKGHPNYIKSYLDLAMARKAKNNIEGCINALRLGLAVDSPTGFKVKTSLEQIQRVLKTLQHGKTAEAGTSQACLDMKIGIDNATKSLDIPPKPILAQRKSRGGFVEDSSKVSNNEKPTHTGGQPEGTGVQKGTNDQDPQTENEQGNNEDKQDVEKQAVVAEALPQAVKEKVQCAAHQGHNENAERPGIQVQILNEVAMPSPGTNQEPDARGQEEQSSVSNSVTIKQEDSDDDEMEYFYFQLFVSNKATCKFISVPRRDRISFHCLRKAIGALTLPFSSFGFTPKGGHHLVVDLGQEKLYDAMRKDFDLTKQGDGTIDDTYRVFIKDTSEAIL